MSTPHRLHVFTGTFGSRADALEYTEERWGPEPPETASDAEYAAWEDNPVWPLATDLGVGWLDHDFIETIQSPEGIDIWTYLKAMIRDEAAAQRIRSQADDADTLVLISTQALPDRERGRTLSSTPRLRYWGAFPR